MYNQFEKLAKNLDTINFYHKDKKEVDFILTTGGNMLPVEVKTKTQLKKPDLNHLKYFMTKHKLFHGLVLYGGESRQLKHGTQTITLLPWI